MDITQACKTIRHCNDRYCSRLTPTVDNADALEAVLTLQRYLQQVRGDGKTIHELQLEERFLCSPQGMRSVMPFLLSAESLLATERRKQSGKL